MKCRVQRSRLVRVTETFECTMPEEMDPEHLVENHPLEFAFDLVHGGDPLQGWSCEVVGTDTEEIDYAETKLEVGWVHPANVLPFRRTP